MLWQIKSPRPQNKKYPNAFSYSGSVQSRKSRYMDSHSNGNSNERSYERQQSTSSPAWNNGPQSSVKSFNGMDIYILVNIVKTIFPFSSY